MNVKMFLVLFFVFITTYSFCIGQEHRKKGRADGCTTITVGRLASADGSVMTSHTCDSHEGKTWLTVIPAKDYPKGSQCPVYNKTDLWTSMDDPKKELLGSIPQVTHSYAYIYGFYGTMNEHQLALGESTFEGRKELESKNGILICYELSRLVMERCKTAREAIELIDELTKTYGYIDVGECLTLADTKEVWQLEILGPGKDKEGKDKKGAVWAAVRIPDDHVGVCANASRICEIDLKSSDYKASENVFSTAIENGWWDTKSGKPFRFCYAYNPDGRYDFGSTRREWRVFSFLAPSLGLYPNANEFPLTIKPEKKVSHARIMEIFRDTFEGTEYDMTKFMVEPVKEKKKEGDKEIEVEKMQKSPYANPFIYYDEMFLHRINGGWDRLGERCLARHYCVYVHVTQSREWLPNAIGGVLWLGYANPATTTYVPIYCGITELPKSYSIHARDHFTKESAWWAFVRVAKLASRIWGHMRVDVAEVRDKLQKEALDKQAEIEKEAENLYKQDIEKAIAFLTKYTNEFCNKVVEEYWKLGDKLWVKYQDKM